MDRGPRYVLGRGMREDIMAKVAIITGAGRGIGAGVARVFAEAGWAVSLMSPSERSVALAKELGGIGRQGSVLDDGDLDALVDATRARFGRIDAVVNNMGHGSGEPGAVQESTVFDPARMPDPLAFPDAVWHSALDMYVLNVVRMARKVTPLMAAQGGGSIVNISSLNATEPRPGYAQMSVLRAALHAFTKLYADKYAAQAVRMNNVLPGFCENVAMSEAAMRSIPMGRTGRFAEIGQVCLFLASEASSYITGQNLLADGGVNRAVR
jgi:NAD(P)-dependent dehydrogenase (short-subunit alcohol dehydrogenase family)